MWLLDMNNLIVATLSGLIVAVVGAWIIKRFGGESDVGHSSRSERRSTYNSVHVRIDAEFIKVVAWLFGLIAFGLFVVYTMNEAQYNAARFETGLYDFADKQNAIIATIAADGIQVIATTSAQGIQLPILTPPAVSYPPIVGDPLRVQFTPGSSGAVISVKRSTSYLLGAKAG